MTVRISHLVVAVGTVLLAGCPKPVEPTPPAAPPEISTFAASAAEVTPGGSVTLSWKVEGADTTVRLERLGAGTLLADPGLEGSHDVTLEAEGVFVLTARNKAGLDTRALRVGVSGREPLVLLSAVPNTTRAGEPITLVYSAPDAATLSLAEVDGEALTLPATKTGSLTVSPRFDTVYRLTAGEKAMDAAVTVTPGIVELKAAIVDSASRTVRLSWQAGGAEALSLAAAGRGEIFTTDVRGTIAEGTFDDTLPAVLPLDGMQSYTLTVGSGEAAVTRTVTIRVGGTPSIDLFSVPALSQEGAQVELKWKTRGAVRLELWSGGVQLLEATSQAQVSEGSHFVWTPATPTTYELRVYDARGESATAEGTTSPIGTVQLVRFDASTNAISAGGEPVTLSWEVTNARRVRITAKNLHVAYEVEGVDAASGSVVVYPNAASTEYILTADNSVGNSLTAPSQIIAVATPSGVKTAPDAIPYAYSYPMPDAEIIGHQVANVVAYEGLPVVTKNDPGAAFVDIRGKGTVVNFPLTEDDYYEEVVLPEAFNGILYGFRATGYTYVIVSPNGWFSLSKTSYGSSGNDDNLGGLPNKSLDEGAMSPFFDDLVKTPESEARVHVDVVGGERRIIVQWTNFTQESVPGSRLTFQAQLYSSGKVVFAYESLVGARAEEGSIGVQDQGAGSAVLAPDVPQAGDTYTFFGPVTTPVPFPVPSTGYWARMRFADGGFMEFLAKPASLTAKKILVTEVNFNPTIPDGEWVELTSTHTAPINLRGWILELGRGQTHRIATDLILPVGGRLLLAASPGAGEGLPVDYVWGPGISMNDAQGTFALKTGDYTYATLGWQSGLLGGPGATVTFDPKRLAPWVYSSSDGGMTCTGRTPYGSNGQLGTPGAANPNCFPYTQSSQVGTNTFESIRLTGQPLVAAQPRGDVFEVTLPFEIRVGERSSDKLWVSTNGFLTLDPITCVPTTSGCYSSNLSSPSTTSDTRGAVAVFWDSFNLQNNAGVFWEARDPDGVAQSGDEFVLVSWENMTLYSSSTTYASDLNFQARLDATGRVEMRFGTMTATTASHAKGSSATTWIESPNGDAALEFNSNDSKITAASTYVYTWEP